MKPSRNLRPPKLKSNYLLYIETGLICSLLAFIGLFNLNLSGRDEDITFKIPHNERLQLQSFPSIIYAPVKPAPPPKAKVPYTEPRHEIVEAHLKNLDIEFSIPTPLPLPAEKKTKKKPNSESSIYVDQFPQLIGGLEQLQKKITYPPEAVSDKIEGRVIVQFIVDKNGRVHNPRIVKGVRDDIDKEALKAIASSRFTPARRHGTAVTIKHLFHIRFKIEYASS